MNQVFVSDRVSQRHPEVSKEDAAAAWKNCICSKPRVHKNPNEYIAVGYDEKGRLLELVVLRDSDGDWLIYHALTPPDDNAIRELGLNRRKR